MLLGKKCHSTFENSPASIPNKVDVALSPGGTIKIFNQNGQVSLHGDAVGFYTKSSLTEIDTRLAALEASNSAQDGEIAANKTWIDGLVATQPFTVSDYEPEAINLTDAPQTILTVEITAPNDGHVTAMSYARVFGGSDGGDVVCGIFPSEESGLGTVPTSSLNVQWFETGGLADDGTLNGNRTFSVTEGQTLTIEWRRREAGGGGVVDEAALAEIFTAAT